MRLTLRQLQVFTEIARQENVSRAADGCPCPSPPPVPP